MAAWWCIGGGLRLGGVKAGVSDRHAGDLGARICGMGDNGRAVGGDAACADGCRRRFSCEGLAEVVSVVRPLFPLRRLSPNGFLAVRSCGVVLFVCL